MSFDVIVKVMIRVFCVNLVDVDLVGKSDWILVVVLDRLLVW